MSVIQDCMLPLFPNLLHLFLVKITIERYCKFSKSLLSVDSIFLFEAWRCQLHMSLPHTWGSTCSASGQCILFLPTETKPGLAFNVREFPQLIFPVFRGFSPGYSGFPLSKINTHSVVTYRAFEGH